MTQPRNPAEPGDSSAMSAARTLRSEFLSDLLAGCLSLDDLDSVVAHDYSAEPRAARQELVMTTIRSLLADGLAVVGEIVGASDERVEPWKLSVDEAMARLHERYVVHYDTWETWGWTTWFALTDLGRRTAEARHR
jgi:hypothetical protein